MKNNTTRRFFVVIHTMTDGLEHAIAQTQIAKDNGANGAILIPDYEKGRERMAKPYENFLYVHELQKQFPDFLIGVNFLHKLSVVAPYVYELQPKLLQIDGHGLDGIDQEKLKDTEFFVGIAFKYSKNVHLTGEPLREHCLEVARKAHVPTTSGDATGSAASLDKIIEIRSYLPEDKRLGIASGVTIDNIQGYLESGVTDFLVATWLRKHVDELDFDILDPEKVKAIADVIKVFNEQNNART